MNIKLLLSILLIATIFITACHERASYDRECYTQIARENCKLDGETMIAGPDYRDIYNENSKLSYMCSGGRPPSFTDEYTYTEEEIAKCEKKEIHDSIKNTPKTYIIKH